MNSKNYYTILINVLKQTAFTTNNRELKEAGNNLQRPLRMETLKQKLQTTDRTRSQTPCRRNNTLYQ